MKLLTAREVAEKLGMSSHWVLDRFEAGELPGYKLGTAVRFELEEVEAWLSEQRPPGLSGPRRTTGVR